MPAGPARKWQFGPVPSLTKYWRRRSPGPLPTSTTRPAAPNPRGGSSSHGRKEQPPLRSGLSSGLEHLRRGGGLSDPSRQGELPGRNCGQDHPEMCANLLQDWSWQTCLLASGGHALDSTSPLLDAAVEYGHANDRSTLSVIGMDDGVDDGLTQCHERHCPAIHTMYRPDRRFAALSVSEIHRLLLNRTWRTAAGHLRQRRPAALPRAQRGDLEDPPRRCAVRGTRSTNHPASGKTPRPETHATTAGARLFHKALARFSHSAA
jgi:hypothetical protein